MRFDSRADLGLVLWHCCHLPIVMLNFVSEFPFLHGNGYETNHV